MLEKQVEKLTENFYSLSIHKSIGRSIVSLPNDGSKKETILHNHEKYGDRLQYEIVTAARMANIINSLLQDDDTIFPLNTLIFDNNTTRTRRFLSGFAISPIILDLKKMPEVITLDHIFGFDIRTVADPQKRPRILDCSIIAKNIDIIGGGASAKAGDKFREFYNLDNDMMESEFQISPLPPMGKSNLKIEADLYLNVSVCITRDHGDIELLSNRCKYLISKLNGQIIPVRTDCIIEFPDHIIDGPVITNVVDPITIEVSQNEFKEFVAKYKLSREKKNKEDKEREAKRKKKAGRKDSKDNPQDENNCDLSSTNTMRPDEKEIPRGSLEEVIEKMRG